MVFMIVKMIVGYCQLIQNKIQLLSSVALTLSFNNYSRDRKKKKSLTNPTLVQQQQSEDNQ